MKPYDVITITQADGPLRSVRVVYQVDHNGWWDTHGSFWPNPTDHYTYTIEDQCS